MQVSIVCRAVRKTKCNRKNDIKFLFTVKPILFVILVE